MDFQSINQLKEQLDSKRPIPSHIVRNLRSVYKVDWTYNSNAIEGNTLTLLETKLVIEEGLTTGGKTLKEHFEAINHAEAIDYVEDMISKKDDISHFFIKNIHRLILKNIDDDNAGKYRNKTNVRISGSRHIPPDFTVVQQEMDHLLEWYRENKDHLHPVELSALFHFKFVYIHPFTDGNGRTARLLMNFILMQFGYPPAIIKAKPEIRLRYYEALEKTSVEGKTDDFIEIVADCVTESLQDYLSMF